VTTTAVEAIASYLQTSTYGTLGTNLFVGTMPESPDICVAVYERDGGSPAMSFGPAAYSVDLTQIQVIVRGAREDYATARDKAKAIRDLLASVVETTLSGVRILRIHPLTAAFPLGPDPLDRPEFTMRFNCHHA
jgi:hypothetical protein